MAQFWLYDIANSLCFRRCSAPLSWHSSLIINCSETHPTPSNYLSSSPDKILWVFTTTTTTSYHTILPNHPCFFRHTYEQDDHGYLHGDHGWVNDLFWFVYSFHKGGPSKAATTERELCLLWLLRLLCLLCFPLSMLPFSLFSSPTIVSPLRLLLLVLDDFTSFQMLRWACKDDELILERPSLTAERDRPRRPLWLFLLLPLLLSLLWSFLLRNVDAAPPPSPTMVSISIEIIIITFCLCRSLAQKKQRSLTPLPRSTQTPSSPRSYLRHRDESIIYRLLRNVFRIFQCETTRQITISLPPSCCHHLFCDGAPYW